MEGRDLAADSVAKSPGGPAKYDKMRASGGTLATTPVAYGTDMDVQMADADADNGAAKKKVRSLCPFHGADACFGPGVRSRLLGRPSSLLACSKSVC